MEPEVVAMHLDHTIVPAKDKTRSAEFYAEIFDLTFKPGHFAQVKINEYLTLDFADEPELWGGRGFESGTGPRHHYAFHVSDEEFDSIFDRVKSKSLAYGSGPFSYTDGKINHRRGGRGFYFEDPNGHLLEVMTVRETGS